MEFLRDGADRMTATERFKALLANALERVCVLEAELEQAQARLAELDGEPSPEGRHHGGVKMQTVFYVIAAVLFALGMLTETTDFASPDDTLAFICFGLVFLSVAHIPLP